MEAVDTTIINTAIPSMAKSLQVEPIALKIALISYLVSLAIFIPISGWLGDKFGIKRVFISAIFIFTASSIWCGFSHDLPDLVLARIVQGIGGSLTMPLGRLIVLRTSQRNEFISKMNIVVMVGALGMMLGPVLGGIITNYVSWRWIFWVNIPFGFIAIIAAFLLLEDWPPKKVHKLDKVGFIFFGSGLALLTLGLSLLSEEGTSHAVSFLVIALALSFLIIYFFHSVNITHPILQTELFRLRTFQVAILGNLFSRIAAGGVPFLLPLLLQIVLGYSPKISGFLLAPFALGLVLVKPFTLHALRFFGYRKLSILNTIALAVSLASFASITIDTPLYFIALLTFFFGFLVSMQFTAMNSLAFAEIDNEMLSSATSIVSTVQQIALSFGVALAALLIRYFSPAYPNDIVLTNTVFSETFLALSVITLFVTVIYLRLKPNDGHELTD